MNKYQRMLFILNLLRTRRNMNAQALAEECQVTPRSIYRDIIALSEANIPIYYDNGYKLASDAFLPPLNFTYDEYQLLKSALESTPLGDTDKYRRVVEELMVKLEAGLSESVRRRSRFTPDGPQVKVASSFDYSKATGYVGMAEAAMARSQCLQIKYESIESGISDRVIEPYFIMFRGHAFYLVAFCRTREAFRTFRLDRILEMQTTSESFDRDTSVTAETYFAGSWSVYSGDPIKIVIEFSRSAAKVVMSARHHSDEQVEEIGDGRVRYTIITNGIEEIQRWILGFGGDAVVVEPEELRRNLAEIGKHLGNCYDQDSR
ncbi:MAG: YafY family transcriptional regulator [candidate division Zixibacteria bacterium]|nr:YafY family transcriptional regulator [candidate division Zixibacteria bacterium]